MTLQLVLFIRKGGSMTFTATSVWPTTTTPLYTVPKDLLPMQLLKVVGEDPNPSNISTPIAPMKGAYITVD